MRKYLLAAVAAAAIASPAVAQDTGPYVGIEGGLLFPNDTNVDIDFDPGTAGAVRYNNAFGIDYKNGYDIDAIAGFDLGMFRIEGELGYKRAKMNEIELDSALRADIEDELGRPLTADELDLDGRTSVTSMMANGLVDFDAGGIGAYVGAGVGRANVKFSGGGTSDSDSAWAYQLIAGVRAPITAGMDAGLKYRYFRTSRLNFRDDLEFGTADFPSELSGRFSSHSLLASLIFNFGRVASEPAYIAPAAPPPAPVAPATQTCPDGSVILATAMCPMAPPPPPPPASPGERG